MTWVSWKAATFPFQVKLSPPNSSLNPTSVFSKLCQLTDTSCLLSLTGCDMTMLRLASFLTWTCSRCGDLPHNLYLSFCLLSPFTSSLPHRVPVSRLWLSLRKGGTQLCTWPFANSTKLRVMTSMDPHLPLSQSCLGRTKLGRMRELPEEEGTR